MWHTLIDINAVLAYIKLTYMPISVILNLVIKMKLKEFRINLNISIKEASITTGVPLRTYIRYENDDNYGNVLKRKQILLLLKEKYEITEEKGILSIEFIVKTVSDILKEYNDEVSFCYLFGSYAKGTANEKSDVDLFISTSVEGLRFVEIIEKLRVSLNKKIDLIRLSSIKENLQLLNEIMRDGIKIYKN